MNLPVKPRIVRLNGRWRCYVPKLIGWGEGDTPLAAFRAWFASDGKWLVRWW